MELRDEPDNSRYVAEIDGVVAGRIDYLIRGDRRVLTHTIVGDEFEGHGVASTLVKFALDDARTSGFLIVPLCPFIAAYIEQHPEYQDLVDVDLFAAYSGERRQQ